MAFPRINITLKRAILFLLLGPVLILLVAWFSRPFLLEWGLEGMTRDAGLSGLEVEVRQLDPWVTRLADIRLKKQDQMELSVREASLFYNPDSLTIGKIGSLSLTGLDLRLSADAVRTPPGETGVEPSEPLEKLVGRFLEAPYLSHLRVRDSKLGLDWGKGSCRSEFFLKGDFHPEVARLILDGSILESSKGEGKPFQFRSKLDLMDEDGEIFLTADLEIPELGGVQSLVASLEGLVPDLPDDFKLLSGRLGVSASTRLAEDSLEDLFLEMNASGLGMKASGFKFNASNLLLFLSPQSPEEWEANAYANLDVDGQFSVTGCKASVRAKGPVYEVTTSANLIKTQGNLPPLEIEGLRLPVLDLTLPPAVPLGQEKEIHFDRVSYEDDMLTLMGGSMAFEMREEGSLAYLQLNPVDLNLGDIGFVDLGYYGLVDWGEFPKISRPQSIAVKRVMLGFESVLENLEMTLRTESLERILVDRIALEASGLGLELFPANLRVHVPDQNPQSPGFALSGATLRIPGENVTIEGLEGEILLESIEPLATKGSQTLSFAKVMIGELEVTEGNFTFRAEPDGTIVIESAQAGLWGGSVGLNESSFQLYGDDFRFNTVMESIDGQRITDLLEEVDVTIEGNFSGSVPFSNEGGKWDFSNGFLQLDPSSTAWLRYDAKGILSGGVAKGTREYEKMAMTEEALEDLKLDSMRIVFKVLEEERQVLISIKGERQTAKRKIVLDYRPNLIARLAEILELMNFSKIGL